MSRVSATRLITTGEAAWYLASTLSPSECLEHAAELGGVILRGETGRRQAAKLRKSGFGGRIWLDPAAYDRPAATRAATLWDPWHQQQQEIGVAEFISPGSHVQGYSLTALKDALRTESLWAGRFGGRASLALASPWLTTGLGDLIRELQSARMPLALAFCHRYDPLGSAAAVRGLVNVLRNVPDVAIVRCDIGALGAIAHGAALGAIGTSSTVRHVFPPDQTGGGPANGPSVFIPELLDYRPGPFLDELPEQASPRCPYECCDNQRLRRFNTNRLGSEATRHNRISISRIAEALLEQQPADRPAHFKRLCQNAVHSAATLSGQARRPFEARPQVEAWAGLT